MSAFIERNTASNEHPRAALISTEGVVRSEVGQTGSIGSPAVVVVTNARLMFVAPDESMDLEEWSVYYSDLAGVELKREADNRVEVITCDGVDWRCALPNANPEVLDAVTRHLRWVDEVRTRLLDLEDRIEETADRIRSHASEMNWDAAHEVYQTARAELDELIAAVQLTTPMADDTLAPELTGIERTLENANVRLYIQRAQSQLKLGRYLVEHEDYSRAGEVLERARSLHRRADGQNDAVRRPDAFAFGRQRELNNDLERLNWELQTVAAEPIRQAQEATVRARETDDLDAAVEYWETAVSRYDRILDLDWWREAQEAAEDIDDARGEREWAVEQLVETRTESAGERWRDGVRNRERGDTAGALEAFEVAISHLERAHELAVGISHENAGELRSQIAEIQSAVDSLQGADGVSDSETSAGPASPQESTDTGTDTNTGTDQRDETVTDRDTADRESGDRADQEQQDSAETETEAADTGGGGPAADTSTVRIQRETFTARETDEWVPPSRSDIVERESPHELTDDLGRISLPDSISARNTDG